MILLTGGTGFLGSQLLTRMLQRGDEVVVIKRSNSNLAKIESLTENALLHLFDIDNNDPRLIFEQYKIDTIIHAATEYGRGSMPIYSILDANLILPLRLAELGIQGGVKCFINSDSFFNKSGNSYSNLLNYSLSKKSLLNWLMKLSGEIKIVNVVLEHIYGPWDSPTKFVEHAIHDIAIEKIQRMRLTHGHQRRDFVYIDDVVDAYMTLIDYGRMRDFRFESFELGTGHPIQICDFVSEIKLLSGSSTVLGFGDLPYRNDEIMYSAADTSRLEQLGWAPQISASEGLARILRAYESR